MVIHFLKMCLHKASTICINVSVVTIETIIHRLSELLVQHYYNYKQFINLAGGTAVKATAIDILVLLFLSIAEWRFQPH